METTFRIRGLDCAHEVKLLREQLNDAPGVRELGFDVVRGRMSASYDPASISITEMMRRVEQAGLKAEIWQDETPRKSEHWRWVAAGLSGLAVAAAVLIEHFEHTNPFVIVLSLVAIALGVVYTARKAVLSLRAFRFDMNVLMCVRRRAPATSVNGQRAVRSHSCSHWRICSKSGAWTARATPSVRSYNRHPRKRVYCMAAVWS